ncbi:MAG: phage portal protein [Pseudomonadota bacterium]
MSLLARLLSGGDLLATSPDPFHDFWYNPAPGAITLAGVRIDQESAQKVSAWYRGRDILATVLAMLPLSIYERLPDDGGALPARSHPLWDVLHDKPNDWQDSFQWRRQSMYDLIDCGNAYDWIIGGPRGFVTQLEPIDPKLVTPRKVSGGTFRGRLLYDVRDPKTGQTRTYNQGDIFHLRGAEGKGILEAARISLGTALATESYASLVFGRGTLNSGVIENPGIMDDEASKRQAQSFITAAGNWHLPKVLEQGSKWVESKMSPEDAQMLLSRKFSVDDMARWLGVPRQMLENNDPSFGNAEQFDRNFIAYSMGPWLSLFEFAINDQLILAQRRYYVQFTREAIVRGDLAARWTAHVAAVNAGIKTVDEVRAVENLNKRGGKADELRDPKNITGNAAVPDEPPAEPPAQKPPPPAEDNAQAQGIAIEAAGRILRKEIQNVQKFAVRHAGNPEGFVFAVTDFYAKHVELVMKTLQVSRVRAEAYCAEQAHQVVNQNWVEALAFWKTPDYAAGLAALALEDAA